jgi:hypothetical protein
MEDVVSRAERENRRLNSPHTLHTCPKVKSLNSHDPFAARAGSIIPISQTNGRPRRAIPSSAEISRTGLGPCRPFVRGSI